jgi:catechol 2,3-dioxygenase-like lactoylglutathione lyase family enzyme
MANEFRSTRDIIIRTDALPEAAEFYRSVFGLPVVHHQDTLVGVETGAFCLYIEKGEKHGPVFEFLVANMDDAKRKLLSAGCTVVEDNPAIPRCYIRDPYGVVFNLAQAHSAETSDVVHGH